MATQDWSPSMFAGQSWSAWADNVPLTDVNDEEETVKSQHGEEINVDSMKLRIKDMPLFGLCPSQDEFYLVLCEKCNKTLKPQAFKQHMVQRHGVKDVQIKRSSSTSHSHSVSSISPKKVEKTELQTVRSMPTKASVKQTPPEITALSRARNNTALKIASVSSVKDKPDNLKKTQSLPFVKVERIPDQVSVKKKVSVNPACDIKPVVSNGSLAAELEEGIDVIFPGEVAEKTVVTPITPLKTPPKIPILKNTLPATTPPISISKIAPIITPATVISPVVSVKPEICVKPILTSLSNTMCSSSSSSSSISSTSNSTTTIKPVTSSNTSPSKSTSISNLTKLPVKEKFLPCKDREYDANKHCGVWIEDIQRSCTRSLTCKTHALSLRRAVKGRCKPFDDLLKEHRIAKEALLKAKALAAGLPPPNSKYSHLLEASEAESAAASSHSKPSSSTTPSPQKISKTQNKTSAAAFQRLSVSGVYPPQTTVREEGGSEPSASTSKITSDGEGDDNIDKDPGHLSYHPRPAAICNFGARRMGGNFSVFSRKVDFVRAAFISALEKRLHPPPHKKLCVESNLPKDSHIVTNAVDPYEFMDAGASANMNALFNSSIRTGSMKQKSKSTSNRTLKQNVGSRSPGSSNMSSSATSGVNPAKRKRSGSGQGSVITFSSPSVSQSQSQTITNVISSLPLNTNCTNSPIATIAIPSMNITGTTIGQFNTAGKTNQMQLQKNNVLGKDGQVNFVLTNLDPLARNGCVNISNTQLGQVYMTDDKNAKKSRTSIAGNKNSGKIVNTIEGLKNFPKSVFLASPNIYMDRTLIAPSTTNSTLMSLSSPMVTSAQVHDTSLTNGIGSPSSDKNLMNRQKVATNPKSITTQGMPLLQARQLTQQNTGPIFTSQNQLNPLQVKSSNLNMNKKVSMQPVSITIPLTSQSNLSALGGQQTQHTFLIRTSTDESGGQHQEIHLQQPLSSSSTNLIS
ncbi:hypothetical protein SNE40_014681 [Patella caerulea]|uniref:SCA7 domain-containing protein n=1 Tax=Patella caerulea TaxID=87958 RepID=A0AAN8PJI0_PATCE